MTGKPQLGMWNTIPLQFLRSFSKLSYSCACTVCLRSNFTELQLLADGTICVALHMHPSSARSPHLAQEAQQHVPVGLQVQRHLQRRRGGEVGGGVRPVRVRLRRRVHLLWGA